MQSLNILLDLKKFLISCPLLEIHENNTIPNIFIGSGLNDPPCYLLNPTSFEPIRKMYLDGSSLRNYVCNFSSIVFFNNEIDQNIKNFKFLDDITNWIDDQNSIRNMPNYWVEIKIVQNNGFWSIITPDKIGQYLIQIQLVYFQG